MSTTHLITPFSPLPEPPSRKVADQEQFDDLAYRSLKAQQGMVEHINNAFIPSFNQAVPAVNDAFANRDIIHAASGKAADAARDAAFAEAAKDSAAQWAEAPHGTLIDGSGHSAKHWAEETALEGQAQVGRVQTAGNDAVVATQSAGSHQINAVQLAGDAAVTFVVDSTDQARQAAIEAKTAAAQAVSMTGVKPASKTQFGFVRVGDGLNVAADGTVSAAFVSVVSTPSVSFPATVGIGYAATLSMTASTAIPTASVVSFEVSFGDQAALTIPATHGAATTTITPTGLASTVMLVIRAVDSEGNTSKDLIMTISQVNVTKTAPGITEPANGATGVVLDNLAVAVQSAVLVGISGTASGTHIQVATDAGFANIVADTGTGGGYRTSWTLPVPLTKTTNYYARARHQWDIYGWSNWGSVGTFTTQNASVNACNITAPAGNATGVSLLPVVTLGAFSNFGPADTPAGTTIHIAMDSEFTDIKASYAGAYTTSWVCNAPLPQQTRHYIRARHHGARFGEGAWGTSSFTTAAIQMTVTTPEATALVTPNPTVTVNVTATAGVVTSRRLDVYQGATLIWQSAAFTGNAVQILANLARGTSYTLAPMAFAGTWIRGTDKPVTMPTMFVGDKAEIAASGTWTPPVPGAEYGVLLWGGGGEGGNDRNMYGGGGGGGYVAAKRTVLSSPISLSIGQSGYSLGGFGASGGATTCPELGMTAMGGGGGVHYPHPCHGGHGGSGGGGGGRGGGGGGGGQGGGGGGGGGWYAHDPSRGGNGQGGDGGTTVGQGGRGTGGGGVFNGGHGYNDDAVTASGGATGRGYGAGGGGGSLGDSQFIRNPGAGHAGPGTGGIGLSDFSGGGSGTGGPGGPYSNGGPAGTPKWYNEVATQICVAGNITPGSGGGWWPQGNGSGGGYGGGYNEHFGRGGYGVGQGPTDYSRPGICVIVMMA